MVPAFAFPHAHAAITSYQPPEVIAAMLLPGIQLARRQQVQAE
ncbi:hypothetical protein AB4Z48_29565 [Cupriavidus sp. 2TAF22]